MRVYRDAKYRPNRAISDVRLSRSEMATTVSPAIGVWIRSLGCVHRTTRTAIDVIAASSNHDAVHHFFPCEPATTARPALTVGYCLRNSPHRHCSLMERRISQPDEGVSARLSLWARFGDNSIGFGVDESTRRIPAAGAERSNTAARAARASID